MGAGLPGGGRQCGMHGTQTRHQRRGLGIRMYLTVGGGYAVGALQLQQWVTVKKRSLQEPTRSAQKIQEMSAMPLESHSKKQSMERHDLRKTRGLVSDCAFALRLPAGSLGRRRYLQHLRTKTMVNGGDRVLFRRTGPEGNEDEILKLAVKAAVGWTSPCCTLAIVIRELWQLICGSVACVGGTFLPR